MKLKSTAQQEEEKRKEREKKLKIYVAARDACFSKVIERDTFYISLLKIALIKCAYLYCLSNV